MPNSTVNVRLFAFLCITLSKLTASVRPSADAITDPLLYLEESRDENTGACCSF